MGDRNKDKCLFINGKFTAQRLTGVQRVAEQLVRQLDRSNDVTMELLCPPGGGLANLENIKVRVIGPRWIPLALWEQLILPIYSSGGHLLNLAGAAPAFAREQSCILHDAAIYDHPEAYTRVFVLWYRWLFRRLIERAAVVFTVSEFSQGRLAAFLGVSRSRLLVLGLGGEHLSGEAVDQNFLMNSGLRRGQYFLAVASDNPTKNLRRLVEAFVALGQSGIKLVLVGGGNSRVFSIDEFDLPPGVLRLGMVNDAALIALYRGALGFVTPSIYEGFGLPLLEAMVEGCPVIAANSASLPEVGADAVLYCDPLDTRSITAALRRMIDEPALRQQFRQRGLIRAKTWTWANAGLRLRAGLGFGGASL